MIRVDYLAPIIFGNYNAVNSYLALPKKPFNHLIDYAALWIKVKFKRYDLVINAVEGSSSGRLLTKLSRAKYKIFGGSEEVSLIEFHNISHIAIRPILDLRYFFRQINGFSDKELPILDLKLTNEEKVKGKLVLENIVKVNKPVIAIFTYATGSKCYCTNWWDEFYTKLKENFLDYKILEILPIEN